LAAARDSSGRALRLALILPAALSGVLIAFGTVLLLLIWATVTRNLELPLPILLTLYGTSAVIALVLADVAVWLALRHSGDPRASRTARCLAGTLPVGALATLGAGVLVARLFHFNHPEISFPLCVVAALAVSSGAVVAGRYWAIRRRTGEPESVSLGARVPV
jgi:cytochrome bd-type quinol oxidase subunit 2